MLKIHDKAPAFCLEGADHQTHTLAEHLGRFIIIYFYPKDDTPGCTLEACAFRDSQAALAKNDCVVYGISRDSSDSHAQFLEKHNLNFTLLSDLDLSVHKAYGVLEDSKTKRSTFLVDRQGYIIKIWPHVRVEGHVHDILETLQALL